MVVGESLFSPGYVDVLVDGRPSCRPVGLVLRRMGLDERGVNDDRKEAAMAATTAQRKARASRARAKKEETASPDARRAKLDHACEVIRKLLADGEWVKSSEVHEKAAKLGVSDSLAGQAKKARRVALPLAGCGARL